MTIKFTFNIPLENAKNYAGQIAEFPPLPEFITLKGPFINGAKGAGSQIITLYEFEKTKFAEALQNISKHVDAFHGIPGFTFSAQVLRKGDR